MAVMAGPFLAMASNAAAASASANSTGNGEVKRRRRTSSTNALQRTASDVSAYELHHHHHHQHGVVTNKDEKAEADEQQQQQQPAVPEASPVLQHAKCECCGMSQECTPEYIRGVRARFAGRWVCGLCAEAVTEEAEKKKGLPLEEALKAHMGVCKRFNGFGRTHPVLFQAEAMREILRRRATATLGPRSRSSINPREVNREVAKAAGTGISRSSSCMTFIADHDFNHRASSSINKN